MNMPKVHEADIHGIAQELFSSIAYVFARLWLFFGVPGQIHQI
ncbi:MAG: hypothetical protein RI913_1075 [Pseudomonadota bacterium]